MEKDDTTTVAFVTGLLTGGLLFWSFQEPPESTFKTTEITVRMATTTTDDLIQRVNQTCVKTKYIQVYNRDVPQTLPNEIYDDMGEDLVLCYE